MSDRDGSAPYPCPVPALPLTALLIVGALVLPVAAPAAQPTGRALVLLERAHAGHAQAAAARGVLARSGARRAGPLVPEVGLLTLAIPAGRSYAAFARELRRDPAVRSVQRERRKTLRLVPNDPALAALEPAAGAPPGTRLQWWIERSGFPRAWDVTRGDGALVAVLDSGIDATHPDFAGKITAAVDYDNVAGHGDAKVDEEGHGTHVASLACAASNNGIGLAGAGFDCGLIVEKVDLSDSSITAAIVDAAKRGADAINLSFGDDGQQPPVQAISEALDYAYRRGIVLVAAAADRPVEEQGEPANVLQPTGTGPQLAQGKGLTVTVANLGDQKPAYAGFGSQISLAAYGAFDDGVAPPGLFGAFPANATVLEAGSVSQPPCGCRTALDGDSRYAYVQGTSMAAPQVAAVGALIRNLNPDLPISELLKLIKRTARRPAGVGWTPNLGWGILDAGAAIDAARVVDLRAPRSRLRAPKISRRRTFTLTWSASDPAPPGLVPSGVQRFEVYVVKGKRRPRLLAKTRKRALRFTGQRGNRYSFYTVAIDAAGNRESAPLDADASTRIER